MHEGRSLSSVPDREFEYYTLNSVCRFFIYNNKNVVSVFYFYKNSSTKSSNVFFQNKYDGDGRVHVNDYNDIENFTSTILIFFF